jgi:beta-fructofuranosidase
MNIPYRPPSGYLGDPIPFYWKGAYHLFYLRALEDGALSGIARWVGSGWNHIVSEDLVSWKELPTAFSPGPGGSQDFSCCATGCIIHHQGVFHAFYPGFSLERPPRSAVCHASSTDLVTWEKDRGNPILMADPRWYEDSFGDTFVFWNDQAQQYWMLVSTEMKTGPKGHRGCLARLTSHDLASWKFHPPFWAPGLPFMEVANLFPLGDRWYLTFGMWLGGRMAAMYRSAESIDGPWCAPGDSQLDSAHWYGMNTISDGRRRLAFGWVPTLEGNRPGGMWEWGGHLGTPRELWSNSAGGLEVRCPPEVLSQYAYDRGDVNDLRPEPGLGTWSVEAQCAQCTVPDRLGIAWLPPAPEPCLMEAHLIFRPGTQRIGFLLASALDLSEGYVLRLEPELHRAVIDYWPRPGHQAPALSRHLHLEPDRPIHCRLLLSHTIIEAFIDDRIVLTARIPGNPTLHMALLVQDGSGRFEKLAIRPVAK